DRTDLLARIESDVAQRVLKGSVRQIAAISGAEANARRLLDRHVRLIGNLETAGGIDPRVEGLPSPSELTKRAGAGRGLVRPEIAVLLAQAKNLVTQELLASPVPDDEVLANRLPDYFPTAFAQVVRDHVVSHPLKREIIATSIADDLVNHVGPGTIFWL